MPFITGMGMTASMIVALGPQNAHLIRNGLLQNISVIGIAAIYIVIDIILITIGVLGVGSLIADIAELRILLSLAAVLFFFGYGFLNIRRALYNQSGAIDYKGSSKSNFLMAIQVSLINPGVLLDTIVIVGGLSSQYQEFADKFTFLIGAAAASFLWFAGLAIVTFFAGSYITSQKIWRIIDFVIGSLMITLSLHLLFGMIANIN